MIVPKKGYVYSIYHTRRGWEKLTVCETSEDTVKMVFEEGSMKGTVRRMSIVCWETLVRGNRIQEGWAELIPAAMRAIEGINTIGFTSLDALATKQGCVRMVNETYEEFQDRMRKQYQPTSETKEKPLKLRVVDIYCFDTTTKDLDAANRVIDKIEGHVTDKNDSDTVVDLLAAGKFVGALNAHNERVVDAESEYLKFSGMEIRIVERAVV